MQVVKVVGTVDVVVLDNLGRMGRTTGGRLRYRSSNSQAAKPTAMAWWAANPEPFQARAAASKPRIYNSASCLQPAWQVNAIASSALRISVCGVVSFGSALSTSARASKLKRLVSR